MCSSDLVNLPLGWRRVRTLPSGLTYFESLDQRFGLYVAVWEVQDQHRSPDEMIIEFARSGNHENLQEFEERIVAVETLLAITVYLIKSFANRHAAFL